MDIRLGDTIILRENWQWWEKFCAAHLGRRLRAPNQIFELDFLNENVIRRSLMKGLKKSIAELRDDYMDDIYQEVTVNLSHISARIISKLLEKGVKKVARETLQLMIYTAIKRIQPIRAVHLHRSLINPTMYKQLLSKSSSELDRFLDSAESAGLITQNLNNIEFLPKLVAEHEFDSVRIENPIEVYANEIAPVIAACAVIDEVVGLGVEHDFRPSAESLFDDELKRYEWDKRIFQQPHHAEINELRTATENPEPFILKGDGRHNTAVLLTHGFLATPAEMRGLAHKLHEQGYSVMATRLRGHGTSPWDLRERSWEDWRKSLENGYQILNQLADKIVLVGFSTGGTLSLVTAANPEFKIAGVCTICAPIKFRNKNMRYVPLMYGANKFVRWLSKYEGVMPFRQTESEHPHINYRHMPIRGLYELTRLVSHTKSVLADIQCPVCILQAEEDHIVEPTSANIIYEKLSTTMKQLHWIEGRKHGIVYGDVGETHTLIGNFVQSVASNQHINVEELNSD